MDLTEITNTNFRELFEEIKAHFFKSEKKDDGLSQPTFEVECSCGAKTLVLYNPATVSFEAFEDGWKCVNYVGWFCGTSGHEQESYVILSNNHNEQIKVVEDESGNSI